MPLLGLGSKQRKFADDEIVACAIAFACEVEGRSYSYDYSQHYRGDDPGPRVNPQYFVPVNSPKGEWPSPFAASDAPIMAQETAAAAERARQVGPVIPFEDQLLVVQGFSGPDSSHGVGEIVNRRDKHVAKMVKAHPECFNLPARPLA